MGTTGTTFSQLSILTLHTLFDWTEDNQHRSHKNGWIEKDS